MLETDAPRPAGHRPHRRLIAGIFLLALLIGAATLTLWGRNSLVRSFDAAHVIVHKIDRRVSLALGRPLRGTPDLARLDERLAEKGLKRGAPVFIRIFKLSHDLELWMQKGERFVHFATYPICRFSGGLGPKLQQGDRQAPEGFYTVGRGQLNPNSRWHRSFNLGYPNAFDAAHGRTGDFLMVHGGCGSIGCYAMTNPVIDEIWALITAALEGGQRLIAVHVFPFRMTDWRMAAYAGSEWAPFWADLKRGHDLFEAERIPPVVSICAKRYAVEPGRPGFDGGRPLRSGCPAEAPPGA